MDRRRFRPFLITHLPASWNIGAKAHVRLTGTYPALGDFAARSISSFRVPSVISRIDQKNNKAQKIAISGRMMRPPQNATGNEVRIIKILKERRSVPHVIVSRARTFPRILSWNVVQGSKPLHRSKNRPIKYHRRATAMKYISSATPNPRIERLDESEKQSGQVGPFTPRQICLSEITSRCR